MVIKMKEKKIRDLHNMPIETKIKYCQILFLMASIDGEVNPLEIKELYRLMANIRVLQNNRISLLTHMNELEDDIKDIIKELFEGLNFQEKNILRFSLIKDLIIIMRADYYESSEERELFNKFKTLLSVTDEQLSLIEDEYKYDISFTDYEIEETRYNKKVKEAITLGASLGTPAAFLYIKEKEANNCNIKNRFKKKKSRKHILKALAMGVISYKTVKWFLNRRINQQELMKEYILKDCTKLQDRAVDYLYKDINYIQGYLQYMDSNDANTKTIENKIVLLKKSLSQLQMDKPRMI